MDTFFKDFSPVSSKQWKQKIQFELKGADYNETLIWKSPEDIQVKPFYHHDELTPEFGLQTLAADFKICETIFVHDLEISIHRANDIVKRGAESLWFTIDDAQVDVVKLLSKINLENISVYFSFSFLSATYIKKIDDFAVEKNLKVFYNLDPIGNFAKDGNWFKTAEKDNFETLNLILNQTKNCSIIGINANLYQNAGANMVQQIAYAVAHCNEYFNRFTINQPIVFQISVGTNYFFEIAKLRAIRLVFRAIADEYKHEFDCHLLVTPTKRNKTIYDYNTNLLRSTTECMSAILGGANAIANLPYDAIYHKNNEFGDRIARNQLLVLKHESYFDKVNNPADGSYYIENLTQQLAEKALALFKDIEKSGGFLKQLNDGIIQRKIQESAKKEQDLFDSNKEILLGTNKYPNKNDKMQHDLELYPFVKNNPRKTLITPIIEKRLSENLEQERLKLENETPMINLFITP